MTEHHPDADPDGDRPDMDRPDVDRPDMDAELRRLFADDRLTLPVAVHAEDAVLAGVQRRRRRRATVAAAGGVLAAAVVAVAGVGLAGLGHSGGTVSAAAPASSPTLTTRSVPSTPATPTTDDADVLGPSGVAGVFLGEPIDTLIATSKMTGRRVFGEQKAANGCVTFTMLVPPASVATEGAPTTVFTTAPKADPLTVSTPPNAPITRKQSLVDVVVSPTAGVVQIGGFVGLHTPEGIALGTPEHRLFQTYRQLAVTGRQGELAAVAPGGKDENYVFLIGGDGAVAELWLRSGVAPTCTH